MWSLNKMSLDFSHTHWAFDPDGCAALGHLKFSGIAQRGSLSSQRGEGQG